MRHRTAIVASIVEGLVAVPALAVVVLILERLVSP